MMVTFDEVREDSYGDVLAEFMPSLVVVCYKFCCLLHSRLQPWPNEREWGVVRFDELFSLTFYYRGNVKSPMRPWKKKQAAACWEYDISS